MNAYSVIKNRWLPWGVSRVVLAVWLIAGIIGPALGQEASKQETPKTEVFDRQIAPLLARHCLECHSGLGKKGGLDLSRKANAMAGGESGDAILPGKAADSLVWQYVESNDMPQDRPPLSDEEKKLLRLWIDNGATWGTEAIDPLAYTTDRRAGYDWWSLRPVRQENPLPVKDETWVRNDVDRFVLARLQAHHLQPAPSADRRTLIRRLSFDLIGLPPKPEAVEKFVNNSSPDAYEELVEELLQSPHYGERWARHWLDVVRFGETQGFERNRIRENAWRYRDWVIDAFNRDLPYDEFVRRQIAGDVLYPGDFDALMATGYHVSGTWDQVGHLEGSPVMQKAARWDHLEDLVGTLGQAFLGLTINCARCHDHKFDPISQQEYYQMAALLGGVNQQTEERTNVRATKDAERESEINQRLVPLRAELTKLETHLRKTHSHSAGKRPVAGLEILYLFGESSPMTLPDQAQAGEPIALEPGKLPRFATEQPPARLIKRVRQSGELTLEVWITPAKDKQSGPARILTLSKDSGQRNFTLGHDGNRFDVRLRTTKTDQNGIPSLASPNGSATTKKTHVVYTFSRDGMGRLYVNGRLASEKKIGGDLTNWDKNFRLGLGDEFTGERRWEGTFHAVALYSRALNAEQVKRHFETQSQNIQAGEAFETLLARAGEEEQTRYRRLQSEREQLEQQLAAVTFSGTAHVIVPQQPPVFHLLERGDPGKPGQVVAPAGLAVLSRAGLPELQLQTDAPEAQRRIELAQWLTDQRNPLLARVFVNRLWHYHFGQGLVDTPSDFGFNGGRPSHPELLDYLAGRFMRNGWKTKDVHRLLVTSATYRQQSRVNNPAATNQDADNQLLWRFNRRRLEGEAIRDGVLFLSGALNPKLGGPSYRDMKINGGQMGTNAEFTTPTSAFSEEVNRRTIYRFWARSGNHPLLEALDCPDPSVMTPRRTSTITPVQALSLLNNTLMEQSAAHLADGLKTQTPDNPTEQIERSYRLVLTRPPTKQEASLAGEFVARYGLSEFCLVLFNTNEFLFVN